MIKKNDVLNSHSSPEEVVDCFIKSLRIPQEYRDILLKSVDSPDVYEDLEKLILKPDVSFGDIPPRIKKIFSDHMVSFRKTVERDISRRIEEADNGKENSCPNNFDVPTESSSLESEDVALSDMTADSFVSSKMKGRWLSSRDRHRLLKIQIGRGRNPDNPEIKMHTATTHMLGKKEALPHLRFYVNGADPYKTFADENNRAWTLSLSCVQDLLEFLDPRATFHYAIIDGYEPIMDEGPLLHLLAILRLYGWEPILISRGLFISQMVNPEKTLKTLVRVGLYWVHIEFDSGVLKVIGLEAVDKLFEAISRNTLKITSNYHPNDHPDSNIWLQNLLDNPNLNKTDGLFFIDSAGSCDEQGKGSQAVEKKVMELVVGHRDTIALYDGSHEFLQQCSLLKSGWQKIIDSWCDYAGIEGSRDASI